MRFPDDLKKVARSPARLIETLKEITPTYQEEGRVVGLSPETAPVMMTSKST
jgi:hypothetical protein